MVAITAINEPFWALVCAWGLTIGRILYAIGYRMKGPKGRIFGAILVDIALLGVFVGAIVSIRNWDLSASDARILPISTGEYNTKFKV